MSNIELNPTKPLTFYQAKQLFSATAELTVLMDDQENYTLQLRETVSVKWDENENPVYNYKFHRLQLDDLSLQQIFRALVKIKQYGSAQ